MNEASPSVTISIEEAAQNSRAIDGVAILDRTTHADSRGELCEAWSPSWAPGSDPLAMIVYVTIHPGQVRGWVVHRRQGDRVFVAAGSARIVLYDARAGSPTSGCVNVLLFGGHRRAAFTIPAGVYHAFENVGADDVIFIDMPNQLYDPEQPDTSRLPLDNSVIPYRWR